ncbi:MAG: PKD domain-containing protein, partial [Flavobacteriales bacterium]|nr:PKD domain-containing protein [Flavobacteriales bacterium]
MRSALLVVGLLPAALLAQEVCNNGIDDDGNGLIDLNDPACACTTAIIGDDVVSYIRNHSFEDRLNGTCCPFGFVHPFSPPYLSCAEGWHQATSATSDYFHTCGYYPAGLPSPPPVGQGAVGFISMASGYMEYVGTCLVYPLPAFELVGGTTYTLSLWISFLAANGQLSQSGEIARSTDLFPDMFPLAIFGSSMCHEFPIGTMDCIGLLPGWQELGRVEVWPNYQWQRVAITFTAPHGVRSVIIGSACDLPAAFDQTIHVGGDGTRTGVMPYTVMDELMLTEAGDQVLSPVTTTGNLCTHDAMAHAQPPAGATGFQWYHNGVALPGQTGTTLDISAVGRGGGIYAMSSTYNGECLMGSAYMRPQMVPPPTPSLWPREGCAPLTVAFADTTGGSIATTTVRWDLGNGTTRTDSAFAYTYTAPGTYDVRLTVRNAQGCERDTSVRVVVDGFLEGIISATPNPTDVERTTVQLSGAGSHGDIIAWWWDLGVADPSTATTPSLSATFPAVPGSYPVMLVVEGSSGCVDTVRSVIVVTERGLIAMPNVFSPNGDGH